MIGNGSNNDFGISILEKYFKIEYTFTFLGWLAEDSLRVRSTES